MCIFSREIADLGQVEGQTSYKAKVGVSGYDKVQASDKEITTFEPKPKRSGMMMSL